MSECLLEFGFYPDAVNDEIQKCYDLISDVNEIIGKYGDGEKTIDIDIDEEAKDRLREYCDFDDMTNSFISAYHGVALNELSQCALFDEMGIYFDNYVNCHDCHIYINSPQGAVEFYEEGDLIKEFEEVIVKKYALDLMPLIEDCLENSGEEYPEEWVISDLEGIIKDNDYIPYSFEDVKQSIEEGKLTDTIAREIEANARPIEQEKGKNKSDVELD